MKYILPALLLILAAFPAQAQHELDGKILHSARSSKDAEKLYEDLKKIVGDLDEQNQRHFLAIYSTYATIAAVKTVEQDVGQAVDACAKANADMKDVMKDRYKKWQQSIKPVLDRASVQVDNMVVSQDYEKPKAIRDFLKRVDDVRKKTSESLSKVPVTTPDACQYLHDKMDDTEKTLNTLLEETLIAIPRTIGTSSQVQATEDKAAKEKAAEEQDKKKETKKEDKSAAAESSSKSETETESGPDPDSVSESDQDS